MDRLDAMAMLVAAVDEGSLARAARKLGRSPASVTRAVALLESRIGERLLHRTTRTLKLTDAGVEQVAVYRQVLAALSGPPAATDALFGNLSVTAPEVFGRTKIVPLLNQFLEENSGVTARTLLVNRLVDMVEEGVDLAIRIAHLPDSILTAVRLGAVRRLVCASPAYMERCGVPTAPSDLAHHACINLQVGGGHEPWRLRIRPSPAASLRTVPVGSRFSVNSQTTAIDMARNGHGICHPLTYQVADEIRAGRLIRLLIAYEPEPTPVQFVFHPSQRRGGIVRSFVDYATPFLRADLSAIDRVFA